MSSNDFHALRSSVIALAKADGKAPAAAARLGDAAVEVITKTPSSDALSELVRSSDAVFLARALLDLDRSTEPTADDLVQLAEQAKARSSEPASAADSASSPAPGLAARVGAAVLATMLGVSSARGDADAGKSWRCDRLPLQLDSRSVAACDRALELSKTTGARDDSQQIRAIADALKADGFEDYVTPEGYVRVCALAARTGVQYYTDGVTTWGEFRPEHEVGSPASLASWSLKPFTDDHPAVFVGIENWRDLAVGVVGADAHLVPGADGELYVEVTIVVCDVATLLKIRNGKVELSAGYTASVIRQPGTWRGRAYEYVQSSIYINHLALVDAGRAGPLARITIDGFAWQQIEPAEQTDTAPIATEVTMQDVKLSDTVTVKMTADQAAAYEKALADARQAGIDAATATATTSLDKLTKQVDALAERLAKSDVDKSDMAMRLAVAERSAKDSAAKIEATARQSLVDTVRAACPKLTIADSMTVEDIKVAATLDLNPHAAATIANYPKSDDAIEQRMRTSVVDSLFASTFAARRATDAATERPSADGQNSLSDVDDIADALGQMVKPQRAA